METDWSNTMSKNPIFSTIHGSHLYGMAHADSDLDTYVVYADKRKAEQTVENGIDTVRVGLVDFLDKAFSGSHQSLEALFSRKKIYFNENYRPMIEACTVPVNLDLAEKYRRTIHKFSFGTLKQRRHAMRLAINLGDLRAFGRFNPTLHQIKVDFIAREAEQFEGDALYERACDWAGFSHQDRIW